MRDSSCPKYLACLDKAAREDTKFNCLRCPRFQPLKTEREARNDRVKAEIAAEERRKRVIERIRHVMALNNITVEELR